MRRTKKARWLGTYRKASADGTHGNRILDCVRMHRRSIPKDALVGRPLGHDGHDDPRRARRISRRIGSPHPPVSFIRFTRRDARSAAFNTDDADWRGFRGTLQSRLSSVFVGDLEFPRHPRSKRQFDPYGLRIDWMTLTPTIISVGCTSDRPQDGGSTPEA